MTLLDSLSLVAQVSNVCSLDGSQSSGLNRVGLNRVGLSRAGLQQSGLALLGALSSFFYFTGSANAAEQAVLQYADRQLTVSLTELKTFANAGTASPELASFIQQIPPTEEFERQLLTDDLPILFTLSDSQKLSRNSEFVLYQINKLIGEPNGTPNYDNLQTALVKATEDQRSFTVLHVMESYPAKVVHVDLRQLDRVYGDVRLFLERLQPLFQSTQLISDWLCECAAPRADGALNPSESCGSTTPVQSSAASGATLTDHLTPADVNNAASLLFALKLLSQSDPSPDLSSADLVSTGFTPNPVLLASSESPAALFASTSRSTSTSPTPVAPTSTASNKRLVVTFGPLGRSFSIAELTELAETGIPSRRLNYYLKLAKVEPAEFQAALNKEVKIDFRLIDRLLSNIIGEYALFRISDVIHTQNRAGDIPALRSALVLSAQDSQITPIEVMQRYPTQEMYLDGLALLKASNTIRRAVKQDFGQVTDRIADWLETIQHSIASEVCNCESSKPPKTTP